MCCGGDDIDICSCYETYPRDLSMTVGSLCSGCAPAVFRPCARRTAVKRAHSSGEPEVLGQLGELACVRGMLCARREGGHVLQAEVQVGAVGRAHTRDNGSWRAQRAACTHTANIVHTLYSACRLGDVDGPVVESSA